MAQPSPYANAAKKALAQGLNENAIVWAILDVADALRELRPENGLSRAERLQRTDEESGGG